MLVSVISARVSSQICQGNCINLLVFRLFHEFFHYLCYFIFFDTQIAPYVLFTWLTLHFITFLPLKDEKEELPMQNFQHSSSPLEMVSDQEEDLRKKRALLADAAEKRRYVC